MRILFLNDLCDPRIGSSVRQMYQEATRLRESLRLEGSKGFTKDLCREHSIPTGAYGRFADAASARAYLADQRLPIVVKADGLAAGKGVVIATTVAEAKMLERRGVDAIIAQGNEAGGHRGADRPGRVGVHGDVGAPVLRRLDRSAKFGNRVLCHIQGVVTRSDASARHEFELRRAERQLLPCTFPDRRRIVGNGRRAHPLAEMEAVETGWQFGGQSKVAMAAALGDHRPARPNPWPGHQPTVDAALESEYRSAHIANTGETAH